MKNWHASGSSYESCNCEAICPCRPQGDRPGGRSTYGVCDFVLSWLIQDGQVDGVDVSDRTVVLAGSYDDDEPGQPWRIVLYVDDRCAPAQHEALTALYLQRLPFSSAIAEVCGIRPAAITLDHTPNAQRIDVDRYVTVRTRQPFHHTETVTCAIPGHDHPGQEIVADVMRIDDPALAWEVRGRCGFATDFSYVG